MKGNMKSTTLADVHLQVRIGGDAALMKGLIKCQLERDAIDHAFIASKTEGFESMVEAAQQTSWEQIVSDSGISEDKIRTAGRLLSS